VREISVRGRPVICECGCITRPRPAVAADRVSSRRRFVLCDWYRHDRSAVACERSGYAVASSSTVSRRMPVLGPSRTATAALVDLVSRAAVGYDPDRVAVCGDSAGGTSLRRSRSLHAIVRPGCATGADLSSQTQPRLGVDARDSARVTSYLRDDWLDPVLECYLTTRAMVRTHSRRLCCGREAWQGSAGHRRDGRFDPLVTRAGVCRPPARGRGPGTGALPRHDPRFTTMPFATPMAERSIADIAQTCAAMG
jgi:hypothetical protein